MIDIPAWALLGALGLGGSLAGSSLIDKLWLAPKQLGLERDQLRATIEAQKAEIAGKGQAYKAEQSMYREYMRMMMDAQQRDRAERQSQTRVAMSEASRTRQQELVMGLLGAMMSQSAPQRQYPASRNSLIGLMGG